MKRTLKVARRCWGRAFGACDTMSGEHVISAGVFRALEQKTVGFDPGGGRPLRSIGIDALTVPNLCSRHNSALSHLDAEAQKLFSALRDLVTRKIDSSTHLNGIGQFEAVIDGRRFERWAAKTFLNVLTSEIGLSRGDSRSVVLNVNQIARQVFLDENFHPVQGLYVLPGGTNYFGRPDFVSIPIALTILDREMSVGNSATGVFDTFRFPGFMHICSFGFEFLLHANLTTLSNDEWDGVMRDYWINTRISGAQFHPKGIKFRIPTLDSDMPDKATRVLRLTW